MKWCSPVAICLMSALALLTSGCGKTETQPKVTGTVTFNGTPVQDGMMQFEPQDGTGTPRNQSVVDGKFEVFLDAGTYRVRITAGDQEKMGPVSDDPLAAGPDFIPLLPRQWNTNSDMTIEVKPGTNAFDFEGDPGKAPTVKAAT